MFFEMTTMTSLVSFASDLFFLEHFNIFFFNFFWEDEEFMAEARKEEFWVPDGAQDPKAFSISELYE